MPDDADLFILYDNLDKVYNDGVSPYMQKAGIGSKTGLGSPTAIFKIRRSLTVSEFDIFMVNIGRYNLINAQIEVTAKAITDRKIEPKEPDMKSAKALGSHVWGR